MGEGEPAHTVLPAPPMIPQTPGKLNQIYYGRGVRIGGGGAGTHSPPRTLNHSSDPRQAEPERMKGYSAAIASGVPSPIPVMM